MPILFHHVLRRFLHEEQGDGLLNYVLGTTVILAALGAAVGIYNQGITNLMTDAQNALSNLIP